MDIIPTRRSFLTFLAAPAIVRASSLMPISAAKLLLLPPTFVVTSPSQMSLYQTLANETRRAFVPRLFVQLYDVSPDFRLLLESK